MYKRLIKINNLLKYYIILYLIVQHITKIDSNYLLNMQEKPTHHNNGVVMTYATNVAKPIRGIEPPTYRLQICCSAN